MMFREKLKNLKAYSLEKIDYKVKLNQNESPYDLPDALKKKVLEKLQRSEWNRYPLPFADNLRELIAKNENWTPEGVMVSPGSNRLIHFLISATALRQKVLCLSPSFSLYRVEGNQMENEVLEIPLNPSDFSLPLDKILETMKNKKPNIVFVANPNAPTGNSFERDSLLKIIKLGRDLNILVVIDEAYYQFTGETVADVLKDFPNLCVMRTFSKAFALGGVRLGFLLANPTVVAEVRKVMPPFLISHFQEAVGEIVIKNPEYAKEIVKKTIAEREALFKELKKLKGVSPYPSQTNFILFNVPNTDDVFKELTDQGVLIRPMKFEGLPGCLRVTVGTPEENRIFLGAISKLL